MADKKLSTDSYKGVRDLYPEDMAIQRFIFQTWSKTAESFGFERYDASILEPAELYKAKGAENEEMVNEQTYTFIDRGEREVTLRPEMTPTVARMVAGQRHELTFPLRWYSIPNLFRYERPQRGRLREHWQLNCDIFGADDVAADVEIIALAYQTLIDFGATPDMFEIKINNRSEMIKLYNQLGINDTQTIHKLTFLNDRKNKISNTVYQSELVALVGSKTLATEVNALIENKDDSNTVLAGLDTLGITNAYIDRTIARGFNYYTQTVFEIFDTAESNNRSMLGGGRYDNLTSMFSDDAISGVGFGMGDVTMRDFLETHKLIPGHIRTTAPQVVIIPMDTEQNLYAQSVAQHIRKAGHKVATDIGVRKLGKKIGSASDRGSKFVIVIGENEMKSSILTVKNLHSGEERSGTINELMNFLDL